VSEDPQAGVERRMAARHLLAHPLTCKEHDPEIFRMIRRYEAELDRWFTQRLGYRLHLTADTARLFKATAVPDDRPLRTASGRPFHHLEYVLLLLVVASTVSGPAVISLKDLLEQVQVAAAETDVHLAGDATERRALVTSLRWLIDNGLAVEVHERVDAYADNVEADAVLRMRPDRLAMLAAPALAGAADPDDLFQRAERREATRQFLRARLVEDPVLYRKDLTDVEWNELRRRLRSEEEGYLDEMFGLVIEARAEGVSAVDPTGALTDVRFPSGGTVGHAALLLIAALRPHGDENRWWPMDEVVSKVAELAQVHARHWRSDAEENPGLLASEALGLLEQVRCVERRSTVAGSQDSRSQEFRLLPVAGRFAPATVVGDSNGQQDALW